MKQVPHLVKLNNGIIIPTVGLGTYQLRGEQVRSAVQHALKVGYRRFDSATVYRNESDIVKAIHQYIRESPSCLFQRSDIFITSKLAPIDHGYDRTMAAVQKSLVNLQTDTIDLYLIHWPGQQGQPTQHTGNPLVRRESYRALEELYHQGKIRAIGVSNYTLRHLEELLGDCTVIPSVVQNEFHPYLYDEELLNFCHRKNIVFEAYSSLGQGHLLNDSLVTTIAHQHHITPSQVLLRWGLQHSVIIIPKSATPDRIEANFDLFSFELSEEEMQQLNQLNRHHHFCWDPTTIV